MFWVPLQALRDPALVEPAIAASVGAGEGLFEYVADKALLVLLDNFEQVVEAAPTVSSLLSGTPNAKVLVTSREPLHVESERRYPVEPLPDGDAEVLFIERARAVAPGSGRHRPSSRSADGSTGCRSQSSWRRHASRSSSRTSSLHGSTGGSRSSPRARATRRRGSGRCARRSSGATSCSSRMSRSSSAASRSSEEASCSRRRRRSATPISTPSSRSSSRTSCAAGAGGRLGMLDTISEYAVELLDAAPDADDVYRRHAEHFLSVAKEANLNSGTLRPGGQRLDIALPEQDNFRGALAWALRGESVALGFEIATALDQLWTLDDPNEGIRWFERLFDRTEAELVSQSLRAQALRAYGSYLHLAGRHAAAEDVLTQGLADPVSDTRTGLLDHAASTPSRKDVLRCQTPVSWV